MKLAVIITLATSTAAFSVFPEMRMAARAAVVSAAVVASVGVTAPDSANAAYDAVAGETVFISNCAVCHPRGQNVIIPDKTLEKEALEQYLVGGRNVEAVIQRVTYGKNAMPAFGGRLGETDIQNIAQFVIDSSEDGWENTSLPPRLLR